jgi:hypothetical protein
VLIQIEAHPRLRQSDGMGWEVVWQLGGWEFYGRRETREVKKCEVSESSPTAAKGSKVRIDSPHPANIFSRM